MKTPESYESEKEFLSNPLVVKNYALLNETGVIKYVESLNRELRNYKSLYAGALDIFNRTTIEEIMNAAVRQVSDHFLPAFMVFLWRPQVNKEDIVIKAYKNYKLFEIDLDLHSLAPFDSFFRVNRKPIRQEQLTKELDAAAVFSTLGTELVIPVLGPSGLYGLMLTGKKTLEDDYTPAEMVYLMELMSFVSQSVQNHLHYEKTLKDAKTGLFNNGFFMTRLNEEIARVQRNNTHSSIIIIDVDKFRDFNETYGHLAGDKVLESLALAIKEELRTEDIPSRFGGEEFIILLPDSGKKSAWAVAERLRHSVAEMKIPWDEPLPRITISLGVFTFNKDVDMDAAATIKQTEDAMRLSKERGRNRTTVWDSGLMARIDFLKLDPS